MIVRPIYKEQHVWHVYHHYTKHLNASSSLKRYELSQLNRPISATFYLESSQKIILQLKFAFIKNGFKYLRAEFTYKFFWNFFSELNISSTKVAPSSGAIFNQRAMYLARCHLNSTMIGYARFETTCHVRAIKMISNTTMSSEEKKDILIKKIYNIFLFWLKILISLYSLSLDQLGNRRNLWKYCYIIGICRIKRDSIVIVVDCCQTSDLFFAATLMDAKIAIWKMAPPAIISKQHHWMCVLVSRRHAWFVPVTCCFYRIVNGAKIYFH